MLCYATVLELMLMIERRIVVLFNKFTGIDQFIDIGDDQCLIIV